MTYPVSCWLFASSLASRSRLLCSLALSLLSLSASSFCNRDSNRFARLCFSCSSARFLAAALASSFSLSLIASREDRLRCTSASSNRRLRSISYERWETRKGNKQLVMLWKERTLSSPVTKGTMSLVNTLYNAFSV